MYKVLLLLVTVAYCQVPPGKKDMGSLLDSIFGRPPSTDATDKPATQEPLNNKNQGPSTIVPPAQNPAENTVDQCLLDDGRKGECLPYYQCNSVNNSAITDGRNIIDIRVNDGACASYIDSCCDVENVRAPGDPLKPTPKPDQPKREGCGWRNPNGADFMTTGDFDGETKFGEFPWTCAILRVAPVNDNDPEGQQLHVYVGGGSLIHPSVVLTTAHYVAQEQQHLHVRAGEWDTQTVKEIYPFQDRDVASVEVHKDFNSGNLFYDIALLFLSEPMELAPNVGLACLPPYQQVTPADTRCFATGWGKDKFGKEGRYQVILKKVAVPVVEHKKCQQQLRQTRLGKYFELHSTFLCAGGEEGIDACRGDGGAPLSCPIESEQDRFMQSGIVAWGIGCADRDVPGVYVNVAKLRDWIDDKVIGKGYDPKVYTF